MRFHDPTVTVCINLHKLHKHLRGLKSIFIFSFVFLDYCAHFCMLIFAQALHRFSLPPYPQVAFLGHTVR